MQYSPSRRTALVLCGTGAHGAYHAGVLRALQEAGVKVDVVAGQGVGAASAVLAAIDGGSRLWDADGIWRSSQLSRSYSFRPAPLIVASATAALVVTACGALVLPVSLRALGAGIALALLLVIAVTIAISRWYGRPRRAGGGAWWAVFGAPLDAGPAIDAFSQAIWQLIRGASHDARPPRDAGRRYAEVLAENLGQPGFRELMIIATDLDARSDVVAALLRDPYRDDFIAPRAGRERRAEALDLAGVGRDRALDVMSAALTPPVVCEPRLVTFAADGFWRGESHRLCERPASVTRLFEELAGVGVSQLIVVTAVTTSPAPHRLRVPRLDLRSRLGEFISAAQATALRDAMDHALLRFDSFYVICPPHNAVGPLDFGGAYDETSDRRQTEVELLEQGYEDAYQQFIDPVVGASGDQITHLANESVR